MIIAISMQKGGVGKTTTTRELGSELARSGATVLLIDLDPQSSLSKSLGVDPLSVGATIYEVMLDPTCARHAIVHTKYGVDLIPAKDTLAGAVDRFATAFMRESLLRTALVPLRGQYDFILIDCPPGLGIFAVNALVASDTVLITLQAHIAAWEQMPAMERTATMVRQLNPSLTISGIVMTMVGHTNITAVIEAQARAQYGDLVCAITIPQSVRIAESHGAGQPIFKYAPESAGAVAYAALTAEVRQRWHVQVRP